MTGCDDILGLEVQGTEVTTGDWKNGATLVGMSTKAKPERRRIPVELKGWRTEGQPEARKDPGEPGGTRDPGGALVMTDHGVAEGVHSQGVANGLTG